jgi:DNA-binding NtrC family response regulator
MPRPRPSSILIVEDDRALAEVLVDEVEARGYAAASAGTVADGVRLVGEREPDVVLLDLMLPDGSGLDLLRRIREEDLPCEVIVLTGHATVSNAIEAMKLGAYDFLTKPTRMEEMEILVAKAAEKATLRRDNARLKRQIERLEPVQGLITQDPSMQELLEMIARVAVSDIPALIQGETGTGKELVARAIHRQSPRVGQPFVAINCSAVSEGLLESELFGHERGAFTGATDRKPGLLEVADRGTLFLDEVGDVSPGVQVKLLRAIETGEFLRVGGVRAVRSDVRVVSASHKDLRRAVGEGQYREDLYHRLNGVTLKLPALRDRPGDVELLAVHFAKEFSGGAKELSARALEILRSYSWPGNVRELRMVVQRAVVLSKRPAIDGRDLLLDLWNPRARGVFKGLTLAEAEYRYIQAVLEEHKGHRGRAAKALGIDPKTLYNKLKASQPNGVEEDADGEGRDRDGD